MKNELEGLTFRTDLGEDSRVVGVGVAVDVRAC